MNETHLAIHRFLVAFSDLGECDKNQVIALLVNDPYAQELIDFAAELCDSRASNGLPTNEVRAWRDS